MMLPTLSARADVTPAAIFSDSMVLQQGMPVPVWGTSSPGEAVEVTLSRAASPGKIVAPPVVARVRGVADGGGKWKVVLPKLTAGGPFTLAMQGKNAVQINDVYAGEVWFCGGQSNMEFTLDRANNGVAEVAAANDPLLREFNAQKAVAIEPKSDVPGKWLSCTPETAKTFSAVAYFFGRELRQKLKVPVGLVHVSAGWTPAEAWMSRRALQSDADFSYILKRWDDITANAPTAAKDYDTKEAAWKLEADKAKADGKPAPPEPHHPIDPTFIHRASGFWNGAVAPLAGYAMRGVIWYQGETNDQRGYQYRKLFPALIRDWRLAWGQPRLPFLWVQLANVLPPDPQPIESEWAEVREAQLMALSLPDTGMAVTIDIGEEKDVHPKNKQDVGHRLALAARAKVYGEKVEYSGPIYRSMKVEGSSIRLTFDHAAGLAARAGEQLKGFDIAGADHKFVHAVARIEKGAVVVASDQVMNPVAVRYAWANNPIGCNLYNGAGLPASPFRTDDWPGKSFGNTRLTIDDM